MKRAIMVRKDGTKEIVQILDENDILKEVIEKIEEMMKKYYKTEAEKKQTSNEIKGK